MKRVRNMLCLLLGLALVLNAVLPGYAHAATGPDMSGWTAEDGATFRTFSNSAGVSRVEFSDWTRLGENNLQFSRDLSLDDAKADINDNVITRGYVGGGPGGVACYSIDNEVLGVMNEQAAQRLRDARVVLTWSDGVYAQDGTTYPLTLTFTNFELDLEDGESLTAPLRFVRTFDGGTLEVNAYYNTIDGGKGVAFDVLMQVGLPEDVFEEGSSMVFTATDLDIPDKGGEGAQYDVTYGKNGAITHYAHFAESVELLGGVLGTVYLEDKTYSDFAVANENGRPLYGDAAAGRFINIERLEGRRPASPNAGSAGSDDPNILVREPGTWFSSTRQTSGADQTKASGFATLVDPAGFKFRWRGSDCGTTLFAQAGLSPELTVRNVGNFPDKITTTDMQLKDADPYHMPANLYVNPTTADRLAHTYRVHWKSQKSVTAQADSGYRVSRVHLERNVAGETTRRSIDVAGLQVGVATPFGDALSTSTATLNEDGTVTVYIADQDPNDAAVAAFMNDYTVEFEAVDDVFDIAVQKEWVGEPAHEAQVELYSNDVLVDTATLTEEGGWRHVFANMPELDAQGDPYVYRLVELPVAGYESRVSGNAHTGFVVTNYATNETVDIAGTKVWNDEDDAAGLRPDSITVRVHAGGEEVRRTTTSAADGWAWSFEGLPKYDRGTLVTYQVTEDAVPGYSTTFDAATNAFTNTHTPETRTIAVSKAWLYGDLTPMGDTSGLTPVVVQLHRVVDLAGGVTEPVAGQELYLSYESGWSGSFVNVPVLVDGEPAQYVVSETPVEGYTSEVSGDADQGFMITNRQNATEVRLQKLAADTGAPLTGAWLTLRNAAGSALATWETDGSEFVISLVPGTYTLEERRAPEDYLVADAIEFVVGYDGTVSVGGSAVDVVSMVDQPVPPLVPEGDPDDDGDDPSDEDGEGSITPTNKETWGEQGDPQTQDAHEMFDSDEEIVRIELIDPETGEPATGPIPARDGDGNEIGTYEIDENGLITFRPNADFVGTAVPATVRATTENGLVSEARYTPHVVGAGTPLANTGGTTTTTTTSPTGGGSALTTTSSKPLPTTADVSMPTLFYALAALASLGFALVLRKRY